MPTSTHQDERPFSRTLLGSFGTLDVLALAVVPLVLVSAYLLPLSTREALLFSYTDPSPVTAFTANYVHIEASHLLSNVGGYLLVVPVAFLLSALSGHRKRFYVAFVTFLLAFPFVLSYLNLAVARPGYTVGFSGVVMAFVGYLPLALAAYLRVYFDVDETLDVSSVLFFLGLAVIAVLSVDSLEAYGLAVASALSALLYALSATENRDAFFPDVRAASRSAGHFELASVALALTVLVPAAAFPEAAADTGVVNRYVHLLGYALGFIATFLTVHLTDGSLTGQLSTVGQ